MKSVIIYNKNKRNAEQFYNEIVEQLPEIGVEVVDIEKSSEADFFIVIGGDGTLINASKRIYTYHKPIVAVNMGSLGFMTEIKDSEALQVIFDLVKGDFKTENRYFLEVSVNGEKHYALNEIVAAKSGFPARMVRINLFSNGEYVNTYRADGIIISSPTGSTAYSMSAGGPIINPKLNAMVITPIAPHTLSTRPIVVPGDDTLDIEIADDNEEIYIMIDGQENLRVEREDKIEIKLSTEFINLVKPESRNYYSVLREKLKWGDDIC